VPQRRYASESKLRRRQGSYREVKEARASLIEIDGAKHFAGRWLAESLLIVIGPPLVVVLALIAEGLWQGSRWHWGWPLDCWWSPRDGATAIAFLGQFVIAGALWRPVATRPWAIVIGLLPFGMVIGIAAGELAWRALLFFPPLVAVGYLVFFATGIFRFVVPFARARRMLVALDRDGLRVRIDGYETYFPTELLGAARIEASRYAPERLLIVTRTGQEIADLPLLDSGAKSKAHALVRELAEREDRAFR